MWLGFEFDQQNLILSLFKKISAPLYNWIFHISPFLTSHRLINNFECHSEIDFNFFCSWFFCLLWIYGIWMKQKRILRFFSNWFFLTEAKLQRKKIGKAEKKKISKFESIRNVCIDFVWEILWVLPSESRTDWKVISTIFSSFLSIFRPVNATLNDYVNESSHCKATWPQLARKSYVCVIYWKSLHRPRRTTETVYRMLLQLQLCCKFTSHIFHF